MVRRTLLYILCAQYIYFIQNNLVKIKLKSGAILRLIDFSTVKIHYLVKKFIKFETKIS